MWPILERELRAGSRKPPTYWLRLMGAGLVVALVAWATLQSGVRDGRDLFDLLYRWLFFAVWIVVPVAAADCISGERREGTLPLILLTSISSWQIVVAKSVSQVLRLIGFGLAALPALAIPFLLGGVKWWEGLLCLAVLSGSFCWALAATLWVSSRSTVWWRASVGSVLVSLIGMILFCCLLLVVVVYILIPSQAPSIPGLFQDSIRRFIIISIAAAITLFEMLENVGPLTRITPSHILTAVVVLLGTSMVILLLGAMAAGWRLARRASRPGPTTPGGVENVFCRPLLFQKLYQAWMRRSLERNPVGWLEQRTWSARVTTWVTLGFVIVAYSMMLAEFWRARDLVRFQLTVAWSLLGVLAYSASSSFHRERENGVLPVLLTSSLSVSEITWGRLRAMWRQFLLPYGLVMVMWFELSSVSRGRVDAHHWTWFFATSFLAVPIVGLFNSLRRQGFLSAFLWTLLTGVLLPLGLSIAVMLLLGLWLRVESGSLASWVLPALQTYNFRTGSQWTVHAYLAGVTQLALGVVMLKRLQASLTRREFAIRSETLRI